MKADAHFRLIQSKYYNGDKNSTAGRMLRTVGEGGMNLSDANNVLSEGFSEAWIEGRFFKDV